MSNEKNCAAVRVCAIADIQCSRGCGTGECKREREARYPVEQPVAAPIDGEAAYETWTKSPDYRQYQKHGFDAGFRAARASQAAPSPADERAAFDILAHLQRQREFSERTFGPGARTAGICDHIRKELKEIEANPSDLTEWIDVVILALDGAWRAGGSPQEIIDAIVAKQTKNEGRTWPDWRTIPADKAIEHDRSQDVCPQCRGKGTVVFSDPEEAFDVTCGVCNGSGQARAASASETGAEGAKDLAERAHLAAGAWANANTPLAEALAYRDGFIAGAGAPAQAPQGVRAWETEDGRVISDEQKQRMIANGGAEASSVRPYVIALGRIDRSPAMAAEAVARVEETSVGPKLFVNDVLVYWWLGCMHDEKIKEIAQKINAAPQPAQADARVGNKSEGE